jgi:hypothetical protein
MGDINPSQVANAVEVYAASIAATAYPDCWTMFYAPVAAKWYLVGGDGAVQYTMTTPWRAYAVNVFDQLLVNITGYPVPDSISVWPYSDYQCNCPEHIAPLWFQNQNRVPNPVIEDKINPMRVPNDNTVDPPTIRPNLSPNRVPNTNILWPPSLNGHIWPTSVVNLQVIPSPLIRGGASPSRVINLQTMDAPLLRTNVGPSQVVNLQSIAWPQIHADVMPNRVNNTNTVDSPMIHGNIQPSRVSNNNTVDSPNIHGNIQPTSVANSQTVNSPKVSTKTFATFVNDAVNISSTSTSVVATFGTRPAVGNTIIVLVVSTRTVTPTSISVADNQGNSYVSAGTKITNGNMTAEIWWANVATSAGTFTVTATTTGLAATAIGISAEQWSGLVSSNPIANYLTGSGTGTTASIGTLNASSNGDGVVAVAGCVNPGGFSLPSVWSNGGAGSLGATVGAFVGIYQPGTGELVSGPYTPNITISNSVAWVEAGCVLLG